MVRRHTPGREPGFGRQRTDIGRLGHARQELQRFVRLAAIDEQSGQPDDGSRVVTLELERLSQRRFVSRCHEEVDLAWRGDQLGDEFLHLRLGHRTDEAVDDLAVAKGEDRGDRLHPEHRSHLRVLVDVHLGELDGAVRRGDGPFEHRSEGAARPTPRRPEIHDDRDGLGAVEHLLLERGVGDVCHAEDPTRSAPRTRQRRRRASGPGSGSVAVMDLVADHPAPIGIRSDAVAAWFSTHLPDARPPLRFSLVAGGRSNLTYRVDDRDGHAYALRRPPVSHVLPTAHDMGREHRILRALAPTAVPVPVPLGLCEDREVTGAPFYVMSFVDGLVLRDASSADRQLGDLAARREAGLHLADTLAALHALDVDGVGLGDLATREDYVHRQLRRWTAQFTQTSQVGAVAPEAVHAVGAALAARVPPQRRATIVHGDFRLDNAVVRPDGTVAAVLDWELCTLGDPMADVGTFLAYWALPADGEPILGRVPASALPGFPTSDELLERYARISGADVSEIAFFMAFGYWRLACILQGVYERYVGGATAGDPDGVEHFPTTVARLTQLAATTLGDS